MVTPCEGKEGSLGKGTSNAWKNHNRDPSKRQPSSTYVSEQRAVPMLVAESSTYVSEQSTYVRKQQAQHPEEGDTKELRDNEDGKRYCLL